jgi:hypothetical protein
VVNTKRYLWGFGGECGELSTLVDNYEIVNLLNDSDLGLFWGLFVYKKM